MSATIYQKHIEEKLKKIFVPQDVKREWSIWENSKDAWKRRSAYAPRLDLALGPFNLTATNKDRDIEIIKDAANNPLILETIQKGQADNQNWRYNANPRCLLAVEIEFSGSSKHILGDYTNASMMGYLGIVISSTQNYEKIKRVGEYAKTLRQLEKAPSDLFCNVVIYKQEEFEDLLTRYIE